MECPFVLPIRSHKAQDGFYRIRGSNGRAICKDIVEEDEADYIVQAINCHEKLYTLLQGAYGYVPEGDCMQKAIEQALKQAEKP